MESGFPHLGPVLQQTREIVLQACWPVALLQRYGTFARREKDAAGPLTSADLVSNYLLSSGLRSILPEAGLLSEEALDGPERLNQEIIWVIDPIDGTREYANGRSDYSISVGLIQNGIPVLGVIAMPAEGWMISASIEEGLACRSFLIPDQSGAQWHRTLELDEADVAAFAEQFRQSIGRDLLLASEPFHCPANPARRLAEARVAVSRTEFERQLFSDWQKDLCLVPEGSIARKLALLACGRTDLVISRQPKHEWDICGGHALLECIPGFEFKSFPDYKPILYNRAEFHIAGLIAGPESLLAEFGQYYELSSIRSASRSPALDSPPPGRSQSDSGPVPDGDGEVESDVRLQLVLDGSGVGIWEYNIRTQTLLVNQRWLEILGYETGENQMSLRNWQKIVHTDDLPGLAGLYDRIRSQAKDVLDTECRLRSARGEYRWMRLHARALHSADGQLLRLAGTLLDVHEDRAYDPVTGLPNQVLFQDRLEQAFYRARSSLEFSFSLVLISIDRFQRLVDSLGPSDADRIIQILAERMQSLRKEKDTVARLSQNELVLLIEDTLDITRYSQRLEKLPELVNQVIQLGKHEVVLTASVGLALYDTSYRYPMQMLRDAQLARNTVQQSGGNRILLYNTLMQDSVSDLLTRETELRSALREHQLQLYYQPIVRAQDRSLAGFEALIRWQHPLRGTLSPDSFIRLSEESGLIIPIGDFVLREAARMLHEIHAMGHPGLFVNVNVSASQLNHPALLETLQRLSHEYNFQTDQFKLEITESVAMHSLEETIQNLQQIHSLGYQMCIDDFGTGYSSLAYLKRLPVSVLKIDRSFIHEITSNDEDKSIVAAIMALARSLQLQVVIEGVETISQLETLEPMQADLYQGFFFSKPLHPGQMISVLRHYQAGDRFQRALLDQLQH
ncbi:MAG: EAL domain-containing protein [Leptospiraceae bacterium]|nr:EAL domain-containing protein [Leptospiraceae bacterium]